jgi:hypothetical protein
MRIYSGMRIYFSTSVLFHMPRQVFLFHMPKKVSCFHARQEQMDSNRSQDAR